MVYHKKEIKRKNNKEMENIHNSLNLELFCTYGRKRNLRKVVREREKTHALVPLLLPLGLRIVLLFDGYMGFCSEILAFRVKH